MTDQGAEQVLIWYNDLENRFADFIRFIPLSSENQNTYLPMLAPLIVEAGSLIDTILKEEYVNAPRPKKEIGIKDYAQHYELTHGFSKVKSLVYHHPPTRLSPFKGWTNKKTGKYNELKWWAAYNQIKHHRIEKYKLSTFRTALQTICALQQIIAILPTFTRVLWRYDLISARNYTHLVGRNIENTDFRDFALVETKLFATPVGHERFPAKIQDISPFSYGSERLAKFLGKW
jgi:hypothetical protein